MSAKPQPEPWKGTDAERAAIEQAAQQVADTAPPITEEQAAITRRIFTASRERQATQARAKRPA